MAAAAVDPRGDDRLWLTVSSFTRLITLALGELGADGSLGRVEVLRQAFERFDAEGVVVTQHAAVSEDGTHVQDDKARHDEQEQQHDAQKGQGPAAVLPAGGPQAGLQFRRFILGDIVLRDRKSVV